MNRTVLARIFTTFAVSACMASGADAQLLWKITREGTGRPSWLLGTHHAAPRSMIDSIGGLRDAMDAADMVCGELDVDSAGSPEIQKMMLDAMRLPEDVSLGGFYTDEELDTVDTFVRSVTGMGLEVFSGFKPAAITASIMQVALMKNMPSLVSEGGLDAVIQKIFRENGKEVAGLETYGMQVDLLYGMPLEEQAMDLLDAAREGLDGMMETLSRVEAAYGAQDLAGLDVLLRENMDGNEEKRMVLERNRNWIPRMLEAMQDKSVLFAVGAGHLPGDGGLVVLLEEAGCTVEPLR